MPPALSWFVGNAEVDFRIVGDSEVGIPRLVLSEWPVIRWLGSHLRDEVRCRLEA
jgi:hypothetical protein